jgi:hypothetical protein
MSKILAPIGLRAASLTLTGSLANLLGTVSTDAADATSGAIRLGSLDLVRLQGSYARHASSTTGRPSIAVDLSMDPATTAPASVGRFFPVYLLDGSSFSAGAIDGLAQAFRPGPSVTGSSIFGTPPIDVRGAHWLRVRLADVDGTNCGAISLLVMGGVA